MNKITTTAGLVALGAATSLQAAVFAPQAGTPSAQKPWSVSATLRGFYDDNYTTSPSQTRRDSFGFEVMPSAGYNLVRDQTTAGINAAYSARYFEDRDEDEWDQSFMLNAKVSHAFTPRYKLDVSDSFVVAQEPTILDPNTVTSPLRTDGDNLRNTATLSFSAGITENLDAVLGYSNTLYDYEQDGGDIENLTGNRTDLNSRSALLDRMEHLFSFNLRQVLLPKTVGVLGYQFGMVDYTADDRYGSETLQPNSAANPRLDFDPSSRNNISHYFYLGVDQAFTPTLNASIRGGVQYTEYVDVNEERNDNFLEEIDDDNWTPYLDANATWLYMPQSYAQLGVRHSRSQTDVGFVPTSRGNPIMDAETTTVYGSVNHRFFGSFVASLIAQYQHSELDNLTDSESGEDLFLAGVNLTYEINRWLATEIGYNYDRLSSDMDNEGLGRSYTRNRVYVGIRATY